MCGRAWQDISDADFQRLFGHPVPVAWHPRYNLTPSQEMLIVTHPGAALARWGLISSHQQPAKYKTFNARLENAERSVLFMDAFARRRALIPLGGSYEWTGPAHASAPVAFTRRDARPLVVAGLYADHQGQHSAAILTTAAQGVYAEVQSRMPVLMPKERWAAWLDPATRAADVWNLANDPHTLLQSVHRYPVSQDVGNARNDAPQLCQPLHH